MQSIVHLILYASPVLIYVVVVVMLFLESCGVPVINTTLLLLTGALAALGHLNIVILSIAAVMGSVLGASLAYLIGKRGGRIVLLRLVARFHINEQKVYVTENWFHRQGVLMIFFSRMTPYVRPFACFLAGITEMPTLRFFTANLTGSLIWCVVILQVGYELGPHWQLALNLIQSYTVPSVICLLALLILYFAGTYLIKRFMRRRFLPVSDDSERPVERDVIEV